jgi:hypothetical protein
MLVFTESRIKRGHFRQIEEVIQVSFFKLLTINKNLGPKRLWKPS